MMNLLKKFFRIIFSALIFLSLTLLFSIFFTTNCKANNDFINSKSTSTITESWNYHLGDFNYTPLQKSIWDENYQPSQWSSFTVPGQPPHSQNSKFIWLSVKLPQTYYKDPFLYCVTYGQEVEAFLDGKQIFSYGKFLKNDKKLRPGTPLIVFSLPNDYSGKTIFFRLHSINSNDIGRINNLVLGSRADVVYMIFNKDVVRAIISFIILFVALLSLFIFFTNRLEHHSFLSLFVSSFIIFLWIFSLTNFKFLISKNNLFWYYTNYLTNFLIPVGFLSFAHQLFEKMRNKNLLAKMWKFQVFFTLIVLSLDVFGFSTFNELMPLDFLFAFIYSVMIIFNVLKAPKSKVSETRLFLIGFSIMLFFTLNDILYIYYKLLPWGADTLHFGYSIFVIFMVITLGSRLMNTYATLKIYSTDIEHKNKTLNHMWKELQVSKNELAVLNENLEEKVKEQTADIRRILDNTKQGFLVLGSDLLIMEGYSIECINIFGEKINGKKFAHLIFPEGEERKYYQLMLKKILHEENEYKKEMYIYLLITEVNINSKIINISYKLIDDKSNCNGRLLMVILTDISESRSLESKMEQERLILKMIVKAVTNYNTFISCVRDFENFCRNKINELLNADMSLSDISFEIFRNVHTFKATFGQLEMVSVVNGLHAFESTLSEICRNCEQSSLANLKMIIEERNPIQWLTEDMNIINKILGKNYFKHEKAIIIDQMKLIEVENKLSKPLSYEEQKDILHEIRNLRYISFLDLLRPYEDFIRSLAIKLKKTMNPIVFLCEDMRVDGEIYQDFSTSLIHVFRNIMNHGIEENSERINLGKAFEGTITCSIKNSEHGILFSITDDGRGLDPDTIKKAALQKGLFDIETLNKMNSDQIYELILIEGFSTTYSVSQLSGRGMGLSAVTKEVKKLGGKLEIKSTPGVGTEFLFTFPL